MSHASVVLLISMISVMKCKGLCAFLTLPMGILVILIGVRLASLLLEVDRTDMDAHVDHFRHEMQWFACIFDTDYGHCDA